SSLSVLKLVLCPAKAEPPNAQNRSPASRYAARNRKGAPNRQRPVQPALPGFSLVQQSPSPQLWPEVMEHARGRQRDDSRTGPLRRSLTKLVEEESPAPTRGGSGSTARDHDCESERGLDRDPLRGRVSWCDRASGLAGLLSRTAPATETHRCSCRRHRQR